MRLSALLSCALSQEFWMLSSSLNWTPKQLLWSVGCNTEPMRPQWGLPFPHWGTLGCSRESSFVVMFLGHFPSNFSHTLNVFFWTTKFFLVELPSSPLRAAQCDVLCCFLFFFSFGFTMIPQSNAVFSNTWKWGLQGNVGFPVFCLLFYIKE